MKILTKKKQEEILKRLSANSIIYMEMDDSEESIRCFADNAEEISFLVGGFKGSRKVLNTVVKHIKAKMGE